jgi:hypothetical protein
MAQATKAYELVYSTSYVAQLYSTFYVAQLAA